MNFDKIIILIAFFIVLATFATNSSFSDETTDMSLVNDVKHISKDSGPRPAGSKEEQETVEYLNQNSMIMEFQLK